MTPVPSTRPMLLACGVLRREIEMLCRRHWPKLDVRFESSMLHMRPELLAAQLDTDLSAIRRQTSQVVLVYGDCCVQMAAYAARPGVTRTRGNNCCELLLGREEYRRLSHEGAFFLIPEWAGRWYEIFTVQLGLTRENAANMMGDMHRKLVYLDTGIVPVPTATLDDCARFCALPWEVHPVSLEPLRAAIADAFVRLAAEKEQP